MNDSVNCYVAAVQARATLGNISEMTLWRWLQNDPTFPRPIVIGRRRYWRVEELTNYMEGHRQTAANDPTPPAAV